MNHHADFIRCTIAETDATEAWAGFNIALAASILRRSRFHHLPDHGRGDSQRPFRKYGLHSQPGMIEFRTALRTTVQEASP